MLQISPNSLVCLWLSDVIAYISMSNILKTEAAQTKLLPAQTCEGLKSIYIYTTTSNGISQEVFELAYQYTEVLKNAPCI